jgi:gluconolactonase
LLAFVLMLLAAGTVRGGSARGELLPFALEDSVQFPGNRHTYQVYVPAAYQPDRPACLFVGLETSPDEAAAALDELIARKQMPVTIAVFVGVGPADRSLQLDSPGDSFARFLLEELLPDLQKRQTSDGRPLRISPDGNDRAIGGVGSGAVAAFTVAWEKPSEFTRVAVDDGAFVAIRGADRYPALIRRFEPRPLRIHLAATPGPGDDLFGDASLAIQALHRSLRWAGHDVPPTLLTTGPTGGRARLGQAMRWLWRGWPKPIALGPGRNPTLASLLVPGDAGGWQLVGEGYRFTEGPTANARGEVLFNDIPASRTYKVGLDGQVTVWLADSRKANGQAFGRDGRLYAIAGGAGQVLAYNPQLEQQRPAVVAEGFSGNDLVVAHNGNVYVTSPPDAREPARPSNVWLVRPDGQKQVVDTGLKYANGVALSPDQRTLYVDDHRSRWVFRYQIQPDGTLKHRQRFCALVVPETADDTSADGIKVDRQGRLFVATRTGLLQICDGDGRVVAILPTPNRRISNLTFGGPDFDVLYATAGDRVWRRKLNVQGANAWAPPISTTQP